MPHYFPSNIHKDSRLMMFVDGENLAIRYGHMLQNEQKLDHVAFERDTLVWSRYAVDAVMAEGRRVVLWFLDNGLSPVLKRRVDHYFDLSEFLFRDAQYLNNHYL
jgi:hypothetical protein